MTTATSAAPHTAERPRADLAHFSQALRPYQLDAHDDAVTFVEQVVDRADLVGLDRRRLYSSPTGCHAAGTKVLLATGEPQYVERVRIGDCLAGDNGRYVVVHELHRGQQTMARITPVKGEPFVVNLDHVLTLVWTTSEGRRRAGDLIDVSVRDYLLWSSNARRLTKLVRRPYVYGGESPGDYVLHPYLLGLLLGDGCLTHGFTIANSSPEVYAEVRRLLPSSRVVRSDHATKGGIKHRIRVTGNTPELRALADFGLLGLTAERKFVPDRYLYKSDTASRLDLIAGLIDTDGSLSGNGYDWISKSEYLAEGLVYLCRSVGLAAYVKPCEKRSQTGSGGTYYRVSISGDTDRVPCRVPRKKARVRRQDKDVLRTGFDVEVLPPDYYYGFSVSGDNRYLMGDFTLTHNSGKGTTQLQILATLREGGLDAVVTTPSQEVLRGFLQRCGAPAVWLAEASEDAINEAGEAIHVWTPTRLRNRVLDGRMPSPTVVLVDEAHHAVDGNVVSGDLFAVSPSAVWLGYTATPFRGNAAGTAALRADWGEPYEILSWPEALALGCVSLPKITMLPLVDDDEITVRGGEFVTKAASEAVLSRVEALAAALARYYVTPDAPAVLDRPTCVTVPSTEVVGQLVEALDRRGLSAYAITQATPAVQRALAYEACRSRRAVLVQIKVIGEGVDLPWLRRLVDASPTLSPVAWAQRVGRVTRPVPAGEAPPEYVCACRNLERHAYVLQGALPRATVAAAQAAFPTPSKRAAARSIGLESLGRLKPIELPLAGGVRGHMFALYSSEGNGITHEWAVLCDPVHDQPIVATRTNVCEAGEERKWGRWVRATLPPDFVGYGASPFRGKISDKQRAWWQRDAAKRGLDDSPAVLTDLTMRQFAALAVLSDLRTNLVDDRTTEETP